MQELADYSVKATDKRGETWTVFMLTRDEAAKLAAKARRGETVGRKPVVVRVFCGLSQVSL